jgi:hypothetical protein
MDPRISIITLGVSDLQASTAFYRDGLKLPFVAEHSNANISFFQVNRGSLWLALFPADKLAEDAGVPAAEPGATGFKGFTLAHNLRTPEAVDDAFREAVAAGATPVKPPQKVFWGGYSSTVADRDGVLWELAHNPYVWIE